MLEKESISTISNGSVYSNGSIAGHPGGYNSGHVQSLYSNPSAVPPTMNRHSPNNRFGSLGMGLGLGVGIAAPQPNRTRVPPPGFNPSQVKMKDLKTCFDRGIHCVSFPAPFGQHAAKWSDGTLRPESSESSGQSGRHGHQQNAAVYEQSRRRCNVQRRIFGRLRLERSAALPRVNILVVWSGHVWIGNERWKWCWHGPRIQQPRLHGRRWRPEWLPQSHAR